MYRIDRMAIMSKLGLIVNPIAGMGGRVGLKGTDGESVYQQALALGAKPQSHNRAVDTLTVIANAMPEINLLTCTGAMGEDVAQSCGFSPVLIEALRAEVSKTTAEDTRHAVLEMLRNGVDLLLFAGGDGTARDICDAIAASTTSSTEMAVLGIPSGVKMHSAVFALTPRRAGEIAARFLLGKSTEVTDSEVMDIDEDAFRSGRVSASLYGYLRTPQDSAGVQATKSGTPMEDAETPAEIARQIIARMEEDTLYIIGPGTTTAAVPEALNIPNSLLGVDIISNKRLVSADATENDLLRLTDGKPTKIIVSVIGGQGYIFGRGNQQISPSIIRRAGKDNIIVVATRRKLLELHGRPLLVDTGDPDLDTELSGYTKVVTGYRESQVHRVSS